MGCNCGNGRFWYWAKIWCPWRLDTVYSMGWLHLIEFILLVLTFSFSLITQPHDMIFNQHLDSNDKQFTELMDGKLPKKTQLYRIQRAVGLLLQWNGMFVDFEKRGDKQPVLTTVALGVALFNLSLLLLAIPVFVKNCNSRLSYDKFHRHDWKIYKGIPGFILTGVILIVTVLLFLAAILSTIEVVQTEMVYEMQFPYCIYRGDYLDNFCYYSKQELGHDEDYCEKIKEALAKSYLCQHPYKFVALMIVWPAILLHILIVVGYGQMAHIPWKREQYLRAIFYELQRKKRVAARAERLGKAAEDKLKILQREKELRNIELRKWDLLLYSQKVEYAKKLFSKAGDRKRQRIQSMMERRKLSELEKAENQKRFNKTRQFSDSPPAEQANGEKKNKKS